MLLHSNMKWNEVDILDFEYNKKKRLVLEMIHIRKNPTCINKQKESAYLSTVYNNIIWSPRAHKKFNLFNKRQLWSLKRVKLVFVYMFVYMNVLKEWNFLHESAV